MGKGMNQTPGIDSSELRLSSDGLYPGRCGSFLYPSLSFLYICQDFRRKENAAEASFFI
jgi:hypothetical protein